MAWFYHSDWPGGLGKGGDLPYTSRLLWVQPIIQVFVVDPSGDFSLSRKRKSKGEGR